MVLDAMACEVPLPLYLIPKLFMAQRLGLDLSTALERMGAAGDAG